MKSHIAAIDVDCQIAPPHIHWRKSAEREICNFNNHMLYVIRSCIRRFPMHLWDHLLDQALLTLNFLCP